MYVCMYVGGCLGVYQHGNDLKLGTVAVLDTMSQLTDFGFKRIRNRELAMTCISRQCTYLLVLNRHGNWIQKTLLTDSFLPLKPQQ